MNVLYFLGIVAALVAGLLIGMILGGGTKYDGTIGLEQQDDGRYAVAIHYDIDELYSTKKKFITLQVLPDRTNPIVNNGNLNEDSAKEEL